MAHFLIRSIPNTITCCNLFCGCLAVEFAFQSNYYAAFICIILGAVFDFFDGMVARLLKVSSAIGKELDSLADVITFGFAPATIVYSLLKEVVLPTSLSPIATYIPYIGFLIAVFSALRLAKFNIDERQTTSFIGMPTPANALFWASISVSAHELINQIPFVLILLFVIGMPLLLVAEIPMFSLKFKSLKLKDNLYTYIFLAGCIVWISFFHITGIAISILWYILLSLILSKRTK